MNYLIVDLNITLDGHKLDFVQQTLSWLAINQKEKGNTFQFLVNQELKTVNEEFIQVNQVEPSFKSTFDNKKGLGKYQAQWNYIKLKAAQLDAHQIVLMEFDIYQIAIGRDRANKMPVSGIWFRPYFRQKAIEKSLLKKAIFNIKKWQKKTVFQIALRSKSLSKVFVLNDQFTVDSLNSDKETRLTYLADPVFENETSAAINIRELYQIDSKRNIFLIFGFLDERKNVLNILKAFKNLSEEDQKKSCLLLVGKSAAAYKPILDKAIANHDSKIQLVVNSTFVENNEMEALFQQSDMVLRMNVNFFASSGIIGMAAKYNVPSLVSDYGIVADLSEEYKLGQLVDPLAIDAIADKLHDFISNKDDWKVNGQPYFNDHNTAAFVKTLLSLD